MSIPLKRTKDILKTLGENKKENQFICGFSMETQNMLENSKKKLEKKNVDMIVANNLKVAGAGFGTDKYSHAHHERCDQGAAEDEQRRCGSSYT